MSDSDSACSVVVDQPTNCGDEFDDSSGEETEADICQLWNLAFGWVHEQIALWQPVTCQDLIQETSHRVTTFQCGLQGMEVEGDTPVSQDLVSSNCLSNQIVKSWNVHFSECGRHTFSCM